MYVKKVDAYDRCQQDDQGNFGWKQNANTRDDWPRLRQVPTVLKRMND
jgi:hypothetical protein